MGLCLLGMLVAGRLSKSWQFMTTCPRSSSVHSISLLIHFNCSARLKIYFIMTSTETTTAPPSTPPEIGTRDKSVGWYTPTLENISEAQRDLLENYSHIAPDRVIPHILEVVR